MTSENCLHYEECAAPLCPMDNESFEFSIWYPEEEICTLKKFQANQFIKTQKKIKLKNTTDNNYFFTYEMLDRNITIRDNTIGIEPDFTGKDEKDYLKKKKLAIKNWLMAHQDRKK